MNPAERQSLVRAYDRGKRDFTTEERAALREYWNKRHLLQRDAALIRDRARYDRTHPSSQNTGDVVHCKGCSTPFVVPSPPRASQRYCVACGGGMKHRPGYKPPTKPKPARFISCERCGLIVQASRGGGQRFCSRTCQYRANYERQYAKHYQRKHAHCMFCGAQLGKWVKMYCSAACRKDGNVLASWWGNDGWKEVQQYPALRDVIILYRRLNQEAQRLWQT